MEPQQLELFSTYSVEQDPEEEAREYATIVQVWGSMGGRETLRRYGRQHFRHLACRKWELWRKERNGTPED